MYLPGLITHSRLATAALASLVSTSSGHSQRHQKCQSYTKQKKTSSLTYYSHTSLPRGYKFCLLMNYCLPTPTAPSLTSWRHQHSFSLSRTTFKPLKCLQKTKGWPTPPIVLVHICSVYCLMLWQGKYQQLDQRHSLSDVRFKKSCSNLWVIYWRSRP